MRWGGVAGGRVVDDLVSLTVLAPTFLALGTDVRSATNAFAFSWLSDARDEADTGSPASNKITEPVMVGVGS